MSRKILSVVMLIVMVTSMFACKSKSKTKVGISFSDFATERWKNEADLMTKFAQ